MLAIIIDSTCDLTEDELAALDLYRVPLYIRFKEQTYKDWGEIGPKDILEGVKAGAELPKTSQPSPQDFEVAYRDVVAAGATEILCLTVSAELSGTLQSATLAIDSAGVPVTVFDSRSSSLGLGDLGKEASRLRAEGADLQTILKALEHIRDTNLVLFTVGNLEFLQKGGRIGGASALLGSLLNIKPILGLEDGSIVPVGRARGSKRALREVVERLQAHHASHPGELVVSFIHTLDIGAVEKLQAAIDAAGIAYENGGIYDIGPVIATHLGPGSYGLIAHTKPAS